MDPNEALTQLLAAAGDWRDNRHLVGAAGAQDAGDRMAEFLDALDAWLTAGGFAPARWDRHTR